ncbi:DUF4062 domain-containing protein [Microbacterium sp. NPDC091382]|uniref:DUF4062 domain-containing protein n=1 Tax=Microbacterium sp. NPDC091382 TaxID=3364210 RepID=UPI00381931E1
MADSLLIDQRSASLALPESELSAWGSGRRVFVSSVITGFAAERAAVRSAIEGLGATPVMFEEELGAQDVSAEQAYLAGVRSSEIYVGLFGARYGVRMSDGSSATHAELLEAEREGLRLCLFVNGESSGEMDRAQRDLVDGARNLYTTSSWSDAADLGRRVRRRLVDLAGEELAPWVRVGRAVFRAKEFTFDDRSVTIQADIRSAVVHDELVRMRDQRSSVPYASASDARNATVSALATRVVSSSRYEERITLSLSERNGLGRGAMTINNIPAEEVARRALSDGLIGTQELRQQMFGMARPIDPLEQLRGASLDDAILRPVASLLFAERLMVEGVAGRVNSFTLGPSHQGSRKLKATWTPPRIYSNAPGPTPVSIEGLISGV